MVEVLDMNIVERRAFWARIRDGESTEPAPDLPAAAAEAVELLDAVATWRSNAQSAADVMVDLLARTDRWMEEAHSAGAERDQAYQAIGRVRDLMDLWEMETFDPDGIDTVATVRKALDGNK